MEREQLQARARVLKALANPDRLKLVDLLSRGECCLCELQPRFALSKSTLSRHVDVLRRVGMVTERRVGVRIFLRLATPCILRALDCAMQVVQADHTRRTRAVKGAAA